MGRVAAEQLAQEVGGLGALGARRARGLDAVVVALVLDWGRLQANFFSLDGLGDNLTALILTGVRNTLGYTVVAFGGGLVLAFGLALMKLSPVLPYRWLATVWVEFFRGVPSLIVILGMAFGVPIATAITDMITEPRIALRKPPGSIGEGVSCVKTERFSALAPL